MKIKFVSANIYRVTFLHDISSACYDQVLYAVGITPSFLLKALRKERLLP